MAEEKPNYRKILEDILRDPKGTTGFATISKKLRDLVELALRSGDEDQIRQLVETKFDYVLRGEKPEAASEPEPKKPATSETKAEPKAADPTDEPESIKKLAGRGVRSTPGRPRIRTRPARELDAPAEPKKPAETKPSDEALPRLLHLLLLHRLLHRSQVVGTAPHSSDAWIVYVPQPVQRQKAL